MSYLENSFKGKIDWWRYPIVIAFVLFGTFLFSLPLSFAIGAKVESGAADPLQIKNTDYVLTLFEANTSLFLMLLPFVGGLIVLLFGVKKLHFQSVKALVTSRVEIDWSRFFFAFGVWGGLVVLTFGIQYVLSPDFFVFNFRPIPFLGMLVLGLILIPLQTSAEEILFRGYLLQGTAVLFRNKWLPLFITSLFFGMMHYDNPEIDKLGEILLVYYCLTGLFLGAIVIMDDGLELSMGFHAANNLVTAILVTADWTAFQTNSIFVDVSKPTLLSAFLPPLVLYPLLFVVFSKKYQWQHWKIKLLGNVSLPTESNSHDIS
jgi:membrane protease YdiL (CAAX protease family)